MFFTRIRKMYKKNLYIERVVNETISFKDPNKLSTVFNVVN